MSFRFSPDYAFHNGFFCFRHQPCGKTILGLSIGRVFRPPPPFRRLLTTSHPYENRCERSSCLICEENNQICQVSCVVYKVDYMRYGECQTGELTSFGKRMDEHLGALRNPQSYSDNPFTSHRTLRNSQDPQLQLQVSILHETDLCRGRLWC